MIDIGIDIRRPALDLRLLAEPESLPLVRQALRSLGEAGGAERDALDDAELAITEACANVVEHAYGNAGGILEVSLRPLASELLVAVRDNGGGMVELPRGEGGPLGEGREGFGLEMIREIATHIELRPREAGGTELVMRLAMGSEVSSPNGTAPPDAVPVDRIARRLVAVIGAQTQMPSDRLVESLLAVEIATRYAPRYLVGDRIQLSLERLPEGFDLRIGPLISNGARAVLRQSELPVIGRVIERLSDHTGVEAIRSGYETSGENGNGPSGGERLRLRIGSRSASV